MGRTHRYEKEWRPKLAGKKTRAKVNPIHWETDMDQDKYGVEGDPYEDDGGDKSYEEYKFDKDIKGV